MLHLVSINSAAAPESGTETPEIVLPKSGQSWLQHMGTLWSQLLMSWDLEVEQRIKIRKHGAIQTLG